MPDINVVKGPNWAIAQALVIRFIDDTQIDMHPLDAVRLRDDIAAVLNEERRKIADAVRLAGLSGLADTIDKGD